MRISENISIDFFGASVSDDKNKNTCTLRKRSEIGKNGIFLQISLHKFCLQKFSFDFHSKNGIFYQFPYTNFHSISTVWMSKNSADTKLYEKYEYFCKKFNFSGGGVSGCRITINIRVKKFRLFFSNYISG